MSRMASLASCSTAAASMLAEPRTSPAMTTRLVVASVSQATRASGSAFEMSIDDGVRDAVAELVRVALGNRFRGKQVVAA